MDHAASLAEEGLTLLWANAGGVVEFESVDATRDPLRFISLVILLASKAFTLAHGRRPGISVKDRLVKGDNSGAAQEHTRHYLQARTTAPISANDCPLRPHLKEGSAISLWRGKGQIDDACCHRSPDPDAILLIDKDFSGQDIRCRSGGRGMASRMTGKRTDVYVVEGRVLTSKHRTADPAPRSRALVVKLGWHNPDKIDREVQSLERIRDVGGIRPEALASGIIDMDRRDPIASLIDALGFHDVQAERDLLASSFWELHANHSIPSVTVYDAEAFDLRSRSLTPRHYLAVASEAVCALTYLWHTRGLLHRDISDGNLASAFSAEELERLDLDGRIYNGLKKRLATLELTLTQNDDRPWWDDWAREHTPQHPPLCHILGLERAVFFADPRTDDEERSATRSATQVFWSQYDWRAESGQCDLIPRYAVDDVESVLYVVVALMSSTRQDELGRVGRERVDWRRLDARETLKAIVTERKTFAEVSASWQASSAKRPPTDVVGSAVLPFRD